MFNIALATAVAATGLDEDMPPLLEACRRAGLAASVLAWDDPTVGWKRFDAILIRSTWDYTERMSEFTQWCMRVDALAVLFNPLSALRWNTDKHYLSELAALGIPTVPGLFVEPDEDVLSALRTHLASHPDAEFVVKPAISAGARDTQRYSPEQEFAAANHIARLLDAGRSALIQPYLVSVDRHGETGLIYFDGRFSHAIRKGALLLTDHPATQAPHATGDIQAREPAQDELLLADQVLTAAGAALGLDQPLAYARVDLIRDDAGNPRLLELELTEPSLFFAQAPAGSADRFASLLSTRLGAGTVRARTASP
jgi:O-ureido-D-serine cyclo-ligase